MTANTYKNMEKADKKMNFLSMLLGIYVIFIGVGLPLVVRHGYFDILLFKYYYYCFCTILMMVLLVGYSLTVGAKRTVLYLKTFTLKSFLKRLKVMDYFVLIYLCIAIVSTCTSDYLYESFWGNEGRFTGLFLITQYVAAYFCISRFWKYKNWYIDLILAAGVFVCLFGITDYFYLDLFHFKVAMVPEQRPIFTSTLGNINTYTAYVGMVTAIAAVLFATQEKIKHIFWYYICMVVGFFAIIMGVSDNAYLSLGALFGFLPLYLFNNRRGIQRYLIVVATFFSVIQCIEWINAYFGDRVLGIDSVFDYVIKFPGLHFLIIFLWTIVLLWYIIDRKRNAEAREYGNTFRYMWLGIIGVVLLAILYVLWDANIAGNTVKYGKISNYVVFNDNWGTHRGYIWRNAMECYLKLSTWKKIVGFGPETFGILVRGKTVNNPYHELFDSAHNEYLHTLVTVGIAGLIAYLTFILSYIKECFCYKNKNPYTIAVAFGVICYSTQAFVNLNLPITTPVFWLLLGIGASKLRKEQLYIE